MDKRMGFVDGQLPLGYVFAEDGAVVLDERAEVCLTELHELSLAA